MYRDFVASCAAFFSDCQLVKSVQTYEDTCPEDLKVSGHHIFTETHPSSVADISLQNTSVECMDMSSLMDDLSEILVASKSPQDSSVLEIAHPRKKLWAVCLRTHTSEDRQYTLKAEHLRT